MSHHQDDVAWKDLKHMCHSASICMQVHQWGSKLNFDADWCDWEPWSYAVSMGLYMVAMPRVLLGDPIPSTLSRLRCLSLEFLWDLMGSPQVHNLGTSSCCSHSCDRKSNSFVHLHVLSVENIVWQCDRSPGCKFHIIFCPKFQACFIHLAPIRTQPNLTS
jgi:hypothetical protein